MTNWLASYPRSGNFMARIMLEHFFDCVTHEVVGYSVKGVRKPRAKKTFVASLRKHKPTAQTVTIQKTHSFEPIGPQTRALVLVRDPRDALVSYAHYLLDIAEKNANFGDVLYDLCTSTAWTDFYRHWAPRAEAMNGCAIVRYEDILANPDERLLGTAERLGWGLVRRACPGVAPSFSELHSAWPKMFRVGKVGANRAELTPRLLAEVERINGPFMRRFGYL